MIREALDGAPRAGLIGLVLGACLVSACTETRQAIGLERRTPDEFAVVSRAPLSMPPDFNLRPPQPGSARPQETQARARAESAILPAGNGATAPPRAAAGIGGPSQGEGALLVQAGADRVQPGIRQTVEQETRQSIESEQSLIDRLIFWRGPEPSGTVVDPAAESQRLASNAALGRPLTEGEVPVIERRQRGILEGIF